VNDDLLDLRSIDPATFERYTGSTFVVELDGEPVPVTLATVTRLPSGPGSPRAQPFALLFVNNGPALGQRTYRLAHADLGVLDIFLVPVGPQADGELGYEAIFN
jgi:hypothetical protein